MSGKSPKASLKNIQWFHSYSCWNTCQSVVSRLAAGWTYNQKYLVLLPIKTKNKCQTCPNISSKITAVVFSDVSLKMSSGFMLTNDETLCQTVFVATDTARIFPENNKNKNSSVATNMAEKTSSGFTLINVQMLWWTVVSRLAAVLMFDPKCSVLLPLTELENDQTSFIKLSSGFTLTHVRSPSRTVVSGLTAFLTSY